MQTPIKNTQVLMDIKEFYSELLEIHHPWQIIEVHLDRSRGSVEIRSHHVSEKKACCPLCEAECPVGEQFSVKRQRHFDTCGTPTYLSAEIPIVRCAEHGEQEAPAAVGAAGLRFFQADDAATR